MQDIDGAAQPYRPHTPVGFPAMSHSDLHDTRTNAFEMLRAPRHTAKLDKLKFITDEFPFGFRERQDISSGITQPDICDPLYLTSFTYL